MEMIIMFSQERQLYIKDEIEKYGAMCFSTYGTFWSVR